MKITKLYSDYDEYYDEKLYSTGDENLDELLERAFCEGYEYAQREFAHMDYAGLSESATKLLKEKRKDYAKGLKKVYRDSQKDIKGMDPSYTTLKTTFNIKGGGISSEGWQRSTKGTNDSTPLKKTHMRGLTDNLLRTSRDAKSLMRTNAIKGI